ncbi:hypothetical protein IFM89_029912 [Coptis chinensis]|uniref:CCHC-type domain-containing protein n=1 Tax=Coptis chinensis TaxID=261450 RepID=A0A835HHX8_9MAGN|nr:hypothetical protein IFM89_029912 [Coptis chinensis]
MQEAKTLSDSLAAIGQPVHNRELVTNIMRGLGSEFHTTVTTILNGGELPEYEDLRARLLTYETQITDSTPTPTPAAFLSYNPSTAALQPRPPQTQQNWHKGKKRNNKNQRGHNYSQQSYQSSEYRPPGPGILGAYPVICQHCGQPGHTTPACRRYSSPPVSLQPAFAGIQTVPQPGQEGIPEASKTDIDDLFEVDVFEKELPRVSELVDLLDTRLENNPPEHYEHKHD